jgi:ubiquinone/menaquinone biosynthesis C-methylase UbiE
MCYDCQDYIQKGVKIIDIGCGSGIIGKTFSDLLEATVIGVDVRDDRVVDLPFQIVDGGKLPFEDDEFDVCLISYVLHHVDNPSFLLQEVKRICKGKIIIYEDLPEGLFSIFRCHIHLMLTNLFLSGIFHWKFSFKTQTEWETLFSDLGLRNFTKKRVYKSYDWIDPVKRILYVLEKNQADQYNTIRNDISPELVFSEIIAKEETSVYI